MEITVLNSGYNYALCVVLFLLACCVAWYLFRRFVSSREGDLSIAREEAGAAGLELKGLITALNQYTTLAERGGLRDGTQALIKVYD